MLEEEDSNGERRFKGGFRMVLVLGSREEEFPQSCALETFLTIPFLDLRSMPRKASQKALFRNRSISFVITGL